MSERPKNRPPARRTTTGGSGANRVPTGGGGNRPPSNGGARRTNVNAPRQQRDPFWIVLGGILGVLLVGLMVVVFIISSNSNSTPVAQAPTATTVAQGAPQPGNPTVANPPVGAADTPAVATDPAPRMPLADFKALYDDPAKRPLIIDVRAKEAFDAGHIKGAISFPESDVDTRVKELPKDKLVIAYCQ